MWWIYWKCTDGRRSLPDTVKVNGKYSLVFDSTDATAVVKYKNMEKEKREQDKNNEDEGR